MKDKLFFNPVRGTEASIEKFNITEGYIYFATDSGKIYLDTATERIVAGGSGASVLYANAKDVQQELINFFYILRLTDLEDKNANPKKDDLIINSNGQFFKIVSVNKPTGLIYCKLIAVSGTSSGGGGGPSGGENGRYVELTCEGKAPNSLTYIYGQSQQISFKANATHDTSALTFNYYVTHVATEETKVYTYTVNNNEVHLFDLGSVLQVGQNTLKVEVITGNSGIDELFYPSISCIELALRASKDFNPLEWSYNSDRSFHFIPVGTVKKRLNVYVDETLEESACKDLLATDHEKSMSVTIPKQSHGVHTLRAELTYSSGVTTITTDPLEYEIVFLEPENNAPVIWFDKIPQKIIDHEKLIIKYMVYDPSSPARTTVRRYINNAEISSLDNVAYSENKWIEWNISNYSLGTNIFTLQCGNSSASVEIYVEEDENRDLSILTSDLYLNLTTAGRSNSENETARQTWTYQRSDNTVTQVKFNNFNWYNNGWIIDQATQDSILRISNGASIEIPLSIMNTKVLDTSLTFEIQFKLRNVQKYENLIETSSTEIKDENGDTIEIKVNKQIKSTDGVWCNYYNNEIGMCLGTQEGFFKSKQVIVSGRYKEDDIVTVSFVAEKPSDKTQYPLMYMYINGIMSSIISYDKSTDGFNSSAKTMIINSNYCDVDIYKIRVYNSALTSSDIVHNYISDQNSAELYDMNQIIDFKDNVPSINFTRMKEYNETHQDSPLQAYAVLECVDKTEDLLPYIKGGKKYVNVTFVNPSLDYAYKEGLITGEQYIMGCPSFEATNIQFDVQGTSSQGYPRRNYKGKFKKADNNSWKYTSGPLAGKEIGVINEYNGVNYKNYYMDNHYSESTFTWKADYMESSMTHNTGFASFVKTLYSKHPLQDYDSSIDVTDRRTTIYGFPMIVFQKKADGSYEFIGRYNYNLDKGCNNVIGFEEKSAHPIIPNKTFADVAECWELLNNQGGRTSFTISDFEATDSNNKLMVLNDFEYRYHPDADDIDDALELKGDFANKTQNEINTFLIEKYSNLRKVAEWLESTNSLKATNEKLIDENGNEITYTFGEKQFTNDTADYRLAKFAKEFNSWFDEEYCAIYFIMTELLLQYDSRGKNMMLATWGPKETGGNYIWYPIFYDIDTQLGVNNSGVPSWEYYTEPSPFDGPGVFSTANSVLWYNFEYNFKETIKTYYRDIRKNNLTYTKLKGYYDYDANISKSYAMMGHRPINIINVDEYWKYIAPTFSGFINTSGTVSKDEGKRFYCLQGDRQLHRDLFLRNRFNFIDSKWLAGAYSQEGVPSELWIRCNANNYNKTSDKYLNRPLTDDEQTNGYQQSPYKANSLDADFTFNVTPYLHQYTSLWFDKTMMTFPTKWDGVNSTVLTVTPEKQESVEQTRPLTQQIFYVGGGEYISSLGDLSRAYLDELILTTLKRLKDLHLGSDDDGYYNSQLIETFNLGANAYDTDGSPNLNTKALLESVVLTNVTSLTGSLNITGAEKLKEFRALGTTLTGVLFADGGQMEIVHLPNTITDLTFIEPTKLRRLISSADSQKDENGNFLPGLYIPGITTTDKLDSSTTIDRLQIVGGVMGYSSYQLMKNLIDIKRKMQLSNTFTNAQKSISISLENILWSPYKLVESGVVQDDQKTYVIKTENSTFIPYSSTDDNDWNKNTLNGLIYEELPEAKEEQNYLTDLSLIESFISEDNLKSRETNYFRDVVEYGDDRPTYPYLSGDIFINNTTDISEYRIKEIIDDYYPDLNIFVAKVDPAYTLQMVEVINNSENNTKQLVELQTVKYERADNVTVNYNDIKVNPSRLYHKFKGWSLTEDGDILTEDQINALTFDSDNAIYTLYAIFEWESYTAYFYDGEKFIGNTDPVIYGNTFYEIPTVPERTIDENLLDLTDRIAFYGWSDKKVSNAIFSSKEEAAKVIININDYVANQDRYFYAIFVKENVFTSATNNKYFIFTRNGNSNTCTISANPNYQLSGKVTLPIDYYDSETKLTYKITHIGDFRSALNAKHIFFMPNGQYTTVIENAFYGDDKSVSLQGVYLPNTIEFLGNNAFSGIPSLQHISENYILTGEKTLPTSLVTLGAAALKGRNTQAGILELETLSQNLKTIGSQALSNAGEFVKVKELPDSLETIGNSAFAHLPKLQITSTNKVINIDANAFKNSGKDVTVLTLESSLTQIYSEAFYGYGRNSDPKKEELSVISYSSALNDDDYINYFDSTNVSFSNKGGNTN